MSDKSNYLNMTLYTTGRVQRLVANRKEKRGKGCGYALHISKSVPTKLLNSFIFPYVGQETA